MKIGRLLLLTLLIHAVAVCVDGQTVTGPDTVVVRSGTLQLTALLWRPQGNGPFPAILFNHGRGLTPQTEGRVAGIKELGRVLAGQGYVFLALFRRGEDLSADQGVFIGDLLERERAAKGDEAAKKLQLRLLETDHLEDALAGLAFLRKLPEVDRQRVGVVGHSFGGSLAMLIAERDKSLRAVVSFAGAAGSWEGSADLRKRLIVAARRLNAPVMSIYAENDYSVAPGKALDAEMTRRSKVHRLRLFPPFGKTAAEGHWFIYLAAASWEREVFAFLDEHMKRQPTKDKVYLGKEVDVKAKIKPQPNDVPQPGRDCDEFDYRLRAVLRVVLHKSGIVTDVTVVKGSGCSFDKEAIGVARRIRFDPARKDGQPVSQYLQVEYEFKK